MAFEVHQDSVGHRLYKIQQMLQVKISTKFLKNYNARFNSHPVRNHTLIHHNIVWLIAKLYSNQPATHGNCIKQSNNEFFAKQTSVQTLTIHWQTWLIPIKHYLFNKIDKGSLGQHVIKIYAKRQLILSMSKLQWL